MSRIVVFVAFAVFFAAGPLSAENNNAIQENNLVTLSHEHEALSGLIASMDSRIAVSPKGNDSSELFKLKNQLLQTKQSIEAQVKAFNRLLSFKLLKGLMEIEAQSEAEKTLYFSILGLSQEEFKTEYITLEQQFQNDPVYQSMSQSLDHALLLLKRAKNGEDISSALLEIQDEVQRALIQRIWDQIQEKKKQKEELLRLTEKSEVDWNYYYYSINPGIHRGGLFILDDYFTKVNQVYPRHPRKNLSYT